MSSLFRMENGILKQISEGVAHCNGRVKISPNGGVLEVLYTSRPVFNWGGFEAVKNVSHLSARVYGEENEQSRRRAYRKVFDYAACNPDVFDLFITITLDKERINRYSIDEIYPKFKNFLSNLVQRDGLAYVIVPEYHKDGAIHFHGLINSSAVQLKDSGKKYWKRNSPCRGQRIYNITNWKFGFTTAVRLKGDYMNVCKYITKYVLKQADGGMVGGRYYYHGGELKGPHYEYINFTEQPEGKAYEFEEASLTVIYVDDLKKCRYEAADIGLSRERVEICEANTTRP